MKIVKRDRQTRGERHGKKRQKKKKIGTFRVVLGVLLIIFTVSLFAMDPIKNWRIANVAEQNSAANITREEIMENQALEVNYDFGVIETMTAISVLRSNVQASEFPVIGWVAIPEVGMNLPIHKGVDNEGMFFGAGTLSPEQEMGESNYSLASHHSIDEDLLFAPLMRAEHGQTIYLTDLDKVYEYTIDYVEHVPNTAVELIYPLEDPEATPIVTLITCGTDLVDHIAVRGTLVQEVSVEDATEEMRSAFGIEETVPGNG